MTITGDESPRRGKKKGFNLRDLAIYSAKLAVKDINRVPIKSMFGGKYIKEDEMRPKPPAKKKPPKKKPYKPPPRPKNLRERSPPVPLPEKKKKKSKSPAKSPRKKSPEKQQPEPESEEVQELPRNRGPDEPVISIRPPEDHDFKETPIYRQFALQHTEYESLEDTEMVYDMLSNIHEDWHLGITWDDEPKKGKKKKKKKPTRQQVRDFISDNRELVKGKIEQALSEMLKEAEITYIINVLKKKDENVGNAILKLPV